MIRFGQQPVLIMLPMALSGCNYTVFGKVDNEGMFCVDRLERGEPPETPDKMVKVTVQ